MTHKVVCTGLCTQCVCYVCPGEHGRSKSIFQERVPSFHHMGSEDQAQVTGLDEESFPAESPDIHRFKEKLFRHLKHQEI